MFLPVESSDQCLKLQSWANISSTIGEHISKHQHGKNLLYRDEIGILKWIFFKKKMRMEENQFEEDGWLNKSEK